MAYPAWRIRKKKGAASCVVMASTAMPNLETRRKISNPTVQDFSPSDCASIPFPARVPCVAFSLSGGPLIKHTRPSMAVQAFRALKPKLLGWPPRGLDQTETRNRGRRRASLESLFLSPPLPPPTPVSEMQLLSLKAGYRSLGLSYLCCWR